MDLYGADHLVSEMEDFVNLYGEQFTPCRTLQEFARDPSKKFHNGSFSLSSSSKQEGNKGSKQEEGELCLPDQKSSGRSSSGPSPRQEQSAQRGAGW